MRASFLSFSPPDLGADELDEDFRQALARSMWKWVAPGGAILWYDFTFSNRKNPDVRGVSRSEIRLLFPGAAVYDFRRVTVAPPISRRLSAISPKLLPLANLGLLKSHVLCWIGKPKGSKPL
jgi:hypothetical protein